MSEEILRRPAPPADFRLPYGDDPAQFGDLRLPQDGGPHPLAIVIHGGFWRSTYDLAHIAPFCARLTEQGIATWNVEYRRIGMDGGGWPGTFEDVAAAADFARSLTDSHGIDLNRVAAVGHSAGGHLAAWVAGRRRIPRGRVLHADNPLLVRGVVALAGVLDLELAYQMGLSNGVAGDLMGGTPDDVPDRYAQASPARLLPLGCRQVLIHGVADSSVPVQMSEAYQWSGVLAGDRVSLVVLPEVGHFELIDPRSKEWPIVLEAVGEVSGLGQRVRPMS